MGQPEPTSPAPLTRCAGLTARGRACGMYVHNGQTHCHSHGGPLREWTVRLHRCAGRNKAGVRCLSKVHIEGERCFYHQVEAAQ